MKKLGYPDMNPRVLLWAKAHDIDPMLLQRESRDEPMYMVGDCPWTVEFSLWIQNKVGEFRELCHGNRHPMECCAGSMTFGQFDRWLYKEVTGEEWDDVGS